MGLSQQKIAVVCNYELLPERVGGMDYFYWLFDKKCKENNIEVDWFFPNESNHGDYKNLSVFSSKYENVENYFLQNYASNKYSHVITHFIEICTPFFKKLKIVSNAKVIAVDHNPRPIDGYPFKKRIEKRVKGFLYSKYIDVFVGVSNYTVNELIKDFGNHIKDKTLTVYNGVIINDIKVREKRSVLNPTFMVASHLRQSKGIQDLIESAALMSPKLRSKFSVDIYGDGPFKNNLLEKVNQLNVQQNFSFKGSKSNLKEIFCNYDYMLQPTHMECFSLSILESLAANVPVITTNVGGNEEAVSNGENGFIYKAKEILELKNILEKVVSNEMSITINTRHLIENNFSLENMVENHFKLLL